jgi:hypothetical protein
VKLFAYFVSNFIHSNRKERCGKSPNECKITGFYRQTNEPYVERILMYRQFLYFYNVTLSKTTSWFVRFVKFVGKTSFALSNLLSSLLPRERIYWNVVKS